MEKRWLTQSKLYIGNFMTARFLIKTIQNFDETVTDSKKVKGTPSNFFIFSEKRMYLCITARLNCIRVRLSFLCCAQNFERSRKGIILGKRKLLNHSNFKVVANNFIETIAYFIPFSTMFSCSAITKCGDSNLVLSDVYRKANCST